MLLFTFFVVTVLCMPIYLSSYSADAAVATTSVAGDSVNIHTFPSPPSSSDSSSASSVVKVLDEKGFIGIPDNIESFSIILFYAPWCSHSKAFLPVYDAASVYISTTISPDINIYKVDCIVEKELYWQQKIDSFPTIKIYFGGREMVYEKERNFMDFVDYIKYLYKNSLLNMDKSLANFVSTKLTLSTPVVTVYIPAELPQAESIDFLQRVDWACKKIETVSCGVTANPTSINLDGGQVYDANLPALFVHRMFKDEPSIVTLDIAMDAHVYKDDSQMFTFLLRSINPMLLEFTTDNDDFLFSGKRPGYMTHVIYVAKSDDQKTKDFFPFARSIGYDNFGKFIFIYADSLSQEPYTEKMLHSLKHAIPYTEPSILMVKSLKTKVEFFKLPVGDDINDESVRHWVKRSLKGEIQPNNVINME